MGARRKRGAPAAERRAALGKFLGIRVTQQLESKWKKQGLPVDDPPALREILEASAQSDVGKPVSLKEELLREQILKIRADRIYRETQQAQLIGKLVDRASTEAEAEAVAALIVWELNQLPHLMAPMLEGLGAKAIEKKMAQQIRKVVGSARRALTKELRRGD